MADLYGENNRSSSLESGEISSFLQTLLHNSSNIPPPPPPPHASFDAKHPLLFGSETIVPGSGYGARDRATTAPSVMVDPNFSLNFSDPGSLFGEGTINTFRSVEVTDNDAITSNSMKTKRLLEENLANDFIFDSERRSESSELPVNPSTIPRGSKRSRAAEVHNMSEKRRRSRINERIKALQNLIPNSNKTDKASMLDEAIEYLKQLQLQVQMLSMRNGLNVHPLYLPGSLEPVQLSQKGVDFGERSGLLNANKGVDTVLGNQETLMRPAFNLSNQCTPSDQPIVVTPTTNLTNSGTSFGSEPSLYYQYGSFAHLAPSKEVCREVSQLQLGTSHSEKNLSSGLSS